MANESDHTNNSNNRYVILAAIAAVLGIILTIIYIVEIAIGAHVGFSTILGVIIWPIIVIYSLFTIFRHTRRRPE